MTDVASELIEAGCANLRQGDVVDLTALPGEDHESRETPRGVVVLSQTCDLVQGSKTRCLVAPVIKADSQVIAGARKGRQPLHLYVGDATNEYVADMEAAAGIPKASLEGKRLLARFTESPSGAGVSAIAQRIGRAFTRFPFPDEVYPAFKDLRARAQSKSGSATSAFGQVIDLLLAIRVSADQWTRPNRRLKLWIVIPEALAADQDSLDSSWSWGESRVQGLKPKDELKSLTLARVCELIVENQEGDLTTLAYLWALFGDHIQEVVQADGEAVVSVEVEVLTDTEMTYADFMRSESLDLEALSLNS